MPRIFSQNDVKVLEEALGGLPPAAVVPPSRVPRGTILYDRTADTWYGCIVDALGNAAWNALGGSGGFITPANHETLRQLIHLADGVGGPMDGWPTGSFRETLPAGSPFPTVITWWTSAAKTAKIVQKDISFNALHFPTMIKWSVYAVDGLTVIAAVTDNITYSGPFELSRTRTVM